MTNPTALSISVSFATDFIISAGGCLTTAMVATGNTAVPSIAVMIFAAVTGLVAASRRVQAMLEQTGTASTKTVEIDPSGAKREVTMIAAPGGVVPKPVAIPLPQPPSDPAPDAPVASPGRWELRDGIPVWIPPTQGATP